MRNICLSAIAVILFSSNAFADSEWNGSTSVRHVIRVQNDGLNTKNATGFDTSKSTTKQYQVRANLGIANKGEMADFGFGVRTYSSPGSEWLSANNAGDLALSIEVAYAKLHKEISDIDSSVTVGRQKTVILNDTLAQMIFDKDVRWDGLGWQFKRENFGFNMSQYVMGARLNGALNTAGSTYSYTEASQSVADTRSGFGMLYSFQPFVKLKLNDEIDGLFAVAYHMWQGTGGSSTSGWYANNIHGGVTGTANSTNPVVLDNSRQWHVYTLWNLPMSFKFSGEFVHNKKIFYGTRISKTGNQASRDGWSLSLLYGQAKKKGEWTVAYSYMNKGIASSINTFSNSDMAADNIGHFFEGKYAVADGFTLGAKAQFMTEKSKLSGDGLAEPAPNQNRKQTSKRYEFVAGVAF